jgi:hypothetical protein
MTRRDRSGPARREAVAANPHCPPGLLEQLAGAPEEQWVRLAVAGNPSSSVTVLRDLAADPDEHLRITVACNPAAPGALVQLLAEDGSETVRAAALSHVSCPSLLVRAAAKSKDAVERAAVAGNLMCPPDVLPALGVDTSRRVRQVALLNPAMSPEDLTPTDNLTCNLMVAQNASTLPLVLQVLSHDRFPVVRQVVARNPRIAGQTVRELVEDEDARVHLTILSHPRCQRMFLARAAKFGSEFERAAVAANPFCSIDLLISLAGDPDARVRRAVAGVRDSAISSVFPALSADDNPSVRASVAANPACLGRLLGELAVEETAAVRGGVASNPAAGPSLVDDLAQDEAPFVRRLAARHVALPLEAAWVLAIDAEWSVASEVARWSRDADLLAAMAADHQAGDD